MMRFMKRLLYLGMTMLLLLSLTAATALAAAETATVTVNVTNTPVRGDVLLEKTGLQLVRFEDEQDTYGNTVMRPVFQNGYLAGAVFELRAAEDIMGKEGSVFYQKDELIETLTTSKTGSVKSKVLPLGKYSLTEISAPDGYVFDSTPHPFTLAAVDKQTAIVEVKVSASNTYLPVRVTLRKQKEDLLLTQTQAGMIHQTVEVYPGEGFVFGLYTGEIITYGDSQKLPANTLVATGTTDANGNLTFSGLYPHGNYYIRELSVPDGWLLSTEKYPVTLTSANKAVSENVITVYLENPILNRLIYTPVTITKTDITGAKKLPGALIEVYDSEGNTIYREYTNENGEIPNIPVVPGTYTFRETYGSARWGKPGDIQPFIDPDPWNNVILTKTERLTMNSRPKNPQYARNKNVLVIGGSGSGKTRFFVKPNLMQCTKTKGTSLVVTDPKGTLVVECGKMLVAAGYDVRIFNTINFQKSMHYNPLSYIHSEKDILKLVTALIANTKGEGKAGEDFWVKAETLLYIALIGYVHYELPPEKQNFATLIDMLDKMQVREDDEDFRNEIDEIFDDLAQRKPEHFAVRQYQKYKMASGKTAKSILVSCGARLAVFDIEELREITSYDELSLDTIGDKRTALFLIMSDTDASFNFLISLAYSQLFNLLCEKADDVYGGRLPVHVRCLIDEFANIGQIPNFEKLIATIRSREISASIILQAQSQLKSIYKDNADTITGNCDTLLFLGGKEKTTLKEMEELLGKETIDTYNTGESRGREVSHSLNYQKLGKSLMSIDELAVMDGGKCILQLRGVRPFLSDKYDITSHPNYKYLSDSNKKNAFDIEKYLSRQLKLRLEEEYEAFEVSVSDNPQDDEALLEEWTDSTQLQAAGYGGLL